MSLKIWTRIDGTLIVRLQIKEHSISDKFPIHRATLAIFQ